MSLTLESWLAHPTDSIEDHRLVGLSELDKALVLAAAAKSYSTPIVAVFSTRAEARNAIDHLNFLQGDQNKDRNHHIPPLDFDFYRGILPNPEMVAERNISLFQALNDPKQRVFSTTLSALLQKGLLPERFLNATQVVRKDEELERETLIRRLLHCGYQRQPTSLDPGTFAVRGGVLDVFSPIYSKPLRLDFFGDMIEQIRFFDPKSQLSQESLDLAHLVPVSISLIPTNEDFNSISESVKERFDDLGIPKSKREEFLEQLQEGVLPIDFQFLFPLLAKGSAPLFEYFPKDTLWFWGGEETSLSQVIEEELPRLEKNHELFEKGFHPVATREALFLTAEELKSERNRFPHVYFEDFANGSPKERKITAEAISLEIERQELHQKQSFQPLLEGFVRRFRNWMDEGYRIHIVCHTQTHRERFYSLFRPYNLSFISHDNEGKATLNQILTSDFQRIHLWLGFISESRVYADLRLVLLSEEQLFGTKKRTQKASTWASQDPSKMLSSFRELGVGDYVVHKEQGIGKYLGLKTMNFLGVEGDYVVVEYRDNDKLYVPVYRLNVVQKYVGAEGAAPALDKLGGDRWAKAKGKAQKAVAELAAELLQIQAKRKLIPAFGFSEPSEDFREFEMEFPFDETPDQQKAIDDVMADLSKDHPMDRLVCGDVGYGKTEVAMRAAFRAVLDGKQVAVLVPTTILAFQHYENFKKRFKGTPARIDVVNRLRTTAQIKQTLADTASGKVDVLIGTHRLLSNDVQFKDLALIVIDEEHRFGVSHKERLKKLMESCHVLTMTATPIPRTLNMALSGIKEISIITTPPPDRLSVRTYVCRDSDEVVVQAITQEIARGGQVFYVHNRIESIFGVADRLRDLLPKLNIEVVHGQMSADELEPKMLSFYQGEANVLLTTAIIESGLDIPRANTILIDQAQNFGLAQLYQLRGRVGRAEKRAYCYLLVPAENLLTADAKQRLQVIQRHTDLGAGFNVASHDLEIRGSGDLLGKQQSGHLNAIGVELYFELLEESVLSLQGTQKQVEVEPEITMPIVASFPNDFLPDISERIQWYRRLSSVKNEEQIATIESEIRDRFGALPEEVSNLLGLMTIKLYLKKLHVTRMACGPKKTSLQFASTTPASPEKLVRLIQKDDPDDRYSVTPDQKLVVEVAETSWKGQLQEIKTLCDYFGIG